MAEPADQNLTNRLNLRCFYSLVSISMHIYIYLIWLNQAHFNQQFECSCNTQGKRIVRLDIQWFFILNHFQYGYNTPRPPKFTFGKPGQVRAWLGIPSHIHGAAVVLDGISLQKMYNIVSFQIYDDQKTLNLIGWKHILVINLRFFGWNIGKHTCIFYGFNWSFILQ